MATITPSESYKMKADIGDIVISLFWIALLFGAVPLLMLWAIGTLSGSPVPITFRTWLASLVITAMVRYRPRR